MKKLYAMLCLFGFMAGCSPPAPPMPTPEEYKLQYEAKQAAAEALANAKLNERKAVIPKGPGVEYTRELTIICLQGIQYYYLEKGWSIWFAPVAIKNYSYPFAECKS